MDYVITGPLFTRPVSGNGFPRVGVTADSGSGFSKVLCVAGTRYAMSVLIHLAGVIAVPL